MNECFICETSIEPVNDAEIEGLELCIGCCNNLDAILRDYLSSSPGGFDLILDIISEDLSSPESRLKEKLKNIIKESIDEL